MNYNLKFDPLIVLQKIDGQDVLFSKKTGDFFGLNESAAFMLKTLVESNFNKAVKVCSQQFGETEDTIRQDLNELVDSLIESKLAEKTPCGE
jgi:hypothetical protein